MEQDSSLFSLTIDPAAKSHLLETAKWARFLAMVGFVFLVLVIFVGIYSTVTINRFEDSYREMGGMGSETVLGSAGTGVAVIYIIMAIIWFFPLIFTLRFANQMRNALQSNDQELLGTSFQNLKVCYRYLGIVTVIFLVMIALSLLFGLMGLAFS
ncbi:MAG TPA: hypothetical protein VGN63_07165 [Flavisolibacter sp.]|jgi:hypothetical protein|nr:hypothetical protein [Flavisolibacter sp.]